MDADTFAGGLWEFSLDFYARPGISQRLIGLQDEHGVEVNLVLLCLYAGRRGYALSQADMSALRAMAALWSHEVVGPLRSARRALKRMMTVDSRLVALRQKTLALELEAEREMQRALAGVIPFEPGAGGEALARGNLAIYLTDLGLADAIPLAGEFAAKTAVAGG